MDDINSRNANNIRFLIDQKKRSSFPVFATRTTARSVLTDYDSFPYQRFNRNDPATEHAVVLEREAGWRPRVDNCYKLPNGTRPVNPLTIDTISSSLAFQPPCSTVLPKTVMDQDLTMSDLVLNNKCIYINI